MVIDSSALIAILFDEPDRLSFERAIRNEPIRLISAVSKLEAGIVLIGRRGSAVPLMLIIESIGAEIVPFDEYQADVARDAFARFGKGRHKAGLNFGDCASYALAVTQVEPLLFKGTDFGATDVEVVRIEQP
jgi:ribonuclease VapC